MSTVVDTHTAIEPNILYFGTPVVLISSMNEDGTPNLAPMSSAFWLGWRAMLGLGARAQTAQNLLRTRECVLNLPSDALAGVVDRLALTTGSDPVPERKWARGYRTVRDKFGRAGLTAVPSETVGPPRVAECPVAMEAVVENHHPVGEGVLAFEVRVQRVWVHEDIRLPGTDDHIDPDAWRPLIMSFQKLYGLGPQVHPSTLASIPERFYRSADLERAKTI
ncbi:NADH-FMN oxidoreductase RutF, flavin reductase (DIM6/NTAB) family [Nonomuraea solani]|uniref:NADH-FMN oxidoreductase RutF, flavin reductase (DIM6/NTAB) family n=1 Tax=Nonomuraea solani TaxID=1144553 RepID=A0A1H6CIM5_9ACTN|nr:flavin reductase family protein [Nonomuraea solani]SEG72782.1 NADH-FMN oxidoreductase RutF, flavin reductase (DIM6/NTAB) family [Nonomuraea solani]